MVDMDPLSIIAVAGLIGYWIFKETPEQKANRERVAVEYERARVQAEIEERKREEERRERKKPFASAEECFQKEYISYTRLSTYCSCPHRFKLVYLDKIRTHENARLKRGKGTILHRSLEICLREQVGQRISQLDGKRIVTAAFGLGYLQYGQKWWSDQRKEAAKKKRDTFRRNVKFICDTFPTGVELIAVEHELRFQLDGLNFYGIVDLVLRYPDGRFEIVDYKTGMYRPIREQLEIYSIPFCEASSRPAIDFRVISVDRESHYRWTQDTRDMTELTRRIRGIVGTILADRSYSPIVGSHCRDCGANNACIYSQQEGIAKYKARPSHTPILTRLGSDCEWKNAITPPRSKTRSSTSSVKSDKPARKNDGSSFSFSRAKEQYRCLKTGRSIRRHEYHFVDHRGKRYCVDAFREMHPERALSLMEGKGLTSGLG